MSSISCSSSGDFTLELTKERIHTNFSDLSTEEKKFDCNASVSASEMSLDISPRWVSSSRPKFTSQPTQILINSPPPPNSMITNFFYKVRSICIRTCRLFYGVVYRHCLPSPSPTQTRSWQLWNFSFLRLFINVKLSKTKPHQVRMKIKA